MLTTQFYGADVGSYPMPTGYGAYPMPTGYGAYPMPTGYGAYPMPTGGLGAIASTAGTAALQTYLKSIGKLSADKVTGVMNDATMAVIFNLLIQSAGTVSKIPLLPADVRDGINKVVSALKTADDKIKSVTFGVASLSTVISQFTTIQAAVRAVSESAANAMLSARDTVYNAVAGQAAIIEKALRIFFPPAVPAPGTVTATGVKTAIPNLSVVGTFLTPGGKPAAVAPTAAPVGKPGMVYAFDPKIGKFRIAVPRGTAGFAGIGVMEAGALGGCIFGDCGLGATPPPLVEQAPSTTAPAAPAQQVPLTQLQKDTGTLPFFKKPLFWAAVGGGVLLVGGGTTFLLMRRRKKAAAASAPTKAA